MTYNMAKTDVGEKLVPSELLKPLVAEYVNKRTLRDLAKEVLEQAQKDHDEVEFRLFEAIERHGLRSIRTPDGTFSLNDLLWAEIEDPDAARVWAEANLPEAITLNHSRLTSVVRSAVKEGDPLPAGVTFRASRKITWRRA